MKREILFRGKRIDNGEWVEGGYMNYSESLGKFSGAAIVNRSGLSNEFLSVAPDTVGQYTGLTDKNGVKIFEGDIVKAFDVDIDEWVNVECFYWEEFCQFAFKNTYTDLNFMTNEEVEVIGNIYDNHELLTNQREQP